jgi:mono/diheme cytochrome c family protein
VTARTAAYAIGAGAALVGSVAVWLTGPVGDASPAVTADGTALDGASLFRAKGCATCHTGPDSTAAGQGFPDLSDATAWAGERVPGMSAENYITQSIRDPIAVISPQFASGAIGTGMPTLTLSDVEVAALVEYLLAP